MGGLLRRYAPRNDGGLQPRRPWRDQRRFDLVQRHFFSGHDVRTVARNLDHSPLIFGGRVLIFLAARGQIQLDALLQKRCGDHENDQQHERQIQQRRDVDVAERHQGIAL